MKVSKGISLPIASRLEKQPLVSTSVKKVVELGVKSTNSSKQVSDTLQATEASARSTADGQKQTTLTQKATAASAKGGTLSVSTAGKQFQLATASMRQSLQDQLRPDRMDGKLQAAAERLAQFENLQGQLGAQGMPGDGDPLGDLGGFLGGTATLPTHTFDVDLPLDGDTGFRPHNAASGLMDGGDTTVTSESTDQTDSDGGQHINENNTTQNPDGSTDTDTQTHDSDGNGNSTETQTVEHTNADGTSYGESTTTTTNADGSSTTTHESWGTPPSDSSSSSGSGSTREPSEGRTTGGGSSSGESSSTSGGSTSGSTSQSTSNRTGGGSSTGQFPIGGAGGGLPDPVGGLTHQLEPSGPVNAPYQVTSKTINFGTFKPQGTKSNPNPDAPDYSGVNTGVRPGTNGLTMPADEFGSARQTSRPLVDRNFGRIDPTPDSRGV